ncbi:thioredoxin domain-containing protein [Actinomycetes bacterium]|nr:thioredoxin domain-containing protein [Actinomycetes bacterium]
MPNRLANSTSPYLLQHQHNPVDWWEWSEAAFAEARRRDVPIFLSIGYSACHWCHVMAHESFEDQAAADYLNANFVSIKVDREERPDIDSVYMDVTVAMTGHGGWPMTVILDHDARPFYAGTYFPPTPRHGLPSFPQLLTAITDSWTQRRDEVLAAGQRIITAMNERTTPIPEGGPPDAADLRAAVAAAERDFDSAQGGFGGAPKFPPSMLLEFLLRESARTDDAFALAMAERTLDAMARGGLFDQLGGGFARYSVDADWVVPHFEKMLYDNALLLRVYAHWWRLTGSALAERVVRQTAGFLLREMRTPEGAFASALDADSEGVEGLFYAWSPAQLIEVLGADDGVWAADLLSVTKSGTFEHGLSTMQLRDEPADLPRWERVRSALFEARAQRVRPGRDDKVVAAWNGLAIAALAEAGALLGEPDWIEAAVAAADLLLAVHLGAHDDDRLCRTSRDGRAGANDGVLDDYGSVAEGFLSLYQVTGADEWLVLAGMLLDITIQHFADGDGGFFDTADDAPALVRRPRDAADNAEPSGWFATANACITFSALTGISDYRVIAERALGSAKMLAQRSPRAAGWGLAAASALLTGPIEIAVIGTPADPRAAELHHLALMSVSPGAVTALAVAGEQSSVPLLRDRPAVDQLATAYVCYGFVCQRPTTSAAELEKLVAPNMTN